MKRAYVDYNPRQATRKLIATCNSIIAEYDGQPMTLRQLHYQLVSRGVQPNTQRAYKRLSSHLSKARMGGLVDWDAIIDRLRVVRARPHFDSPADAVQEVARQYAIDTWADQPYRVEVWIEKDALIGVLEDFCEQHDVPLFAARGNGSTTCLQEAAELRIKAREARGQRTVIALMTDHDPTGLCIGEAARDALEAMGARPIVCRVALTREQAEARGVPPIPTKKKDSRSPAYIAQHGDRCWELDCLSPLELQGEVLAVIERYREDERWLAALGREQEQREQLARIAAGVQS
ncbi:MAG: hypothetical protein KC503_21015 [Myxococcales bacterium]|nr:hypothetical protein [Myxococcales bacterium]